MAWAPRQTRGFRDKGGKVRSLLVRTQATEVRNVWLRTFRKGAVMAPSHKCHTTPLLGTLAWDLIPNRTEREVTGAAGLGVKEEHSLGFASLNPVRVCNVFLGGQPGALGRRGVPHKGIGGRDPWCWWGGCYRDMGRTEPIESVRAAIKDS